MRTVPSLSSWTTAGLYVFGFLLFFWPFADLVTNALPLQPGNLQWRYGFAGLMSAYLHTPIIGLLIATGVAYARGHVRTLRLLSVFEGLVALGLVVIAMAFVLDLLQVRASRPAESQPAVLAGGAIAVAKHLSSTVVLVLLAIGGWKTSGQFSAGGGASEAPAAGIVMKKGG